MAEATVTALPPVPGRLTIAFQLPDRFIDGASVKPLTFAAFLECVDQAQAMTQPKTWEARLRRARLLRQVTFYIVGVITPVSEVEMLQLPIPVARDLIAKLDDGEGKPGKVIRPGDGIDKAITYELGTPIQVGQNKPPIAELEFLAKTYGEIEDVMAAPGELQQARMLIELIAKPLGTSLTALPSWGVNQISIADGITISRVVLPHFFGSPVE